MPPFLPRKRTISNDDSSSKPPTKKLKSDRIFSAPRKPTLFDDLDAGTKQKLPIEQRSAELEQLTKSCDDESSLSSISDQSEDDNPSEKRKTLENNSETDDEEDIEFEDVETSAPLKPSAFAPSGDLELTLTKDTRIPITNPSNSKRAPSKIERQIRISTHKCHVQTLMWHNAIRNSWLCDKELHEVLLKQLPSKILLQIENLKEKMQIHEQASIDNDDNNVENLRETKVLSKGRKTRTQAAEKLPKDQNSLHRLLKILVRYWHQTFKITAPGLRKTGYMSLQRLDEVLKSFNNDEHDPEVHGERFHNLEHYKECARTMKGSRDFGAQIFTALLRAIGLKTRMVTSLQPAGFGWSQTEEAVDKNHLTFKENKHIQSATDSDSNTEDSSANEKSAKRQKATNKIASVPRNSKSLSISKANKLRGKSIRSRTSASDIESDVLSISSLSSEDGSTVRNTNAKGRSPSSKYFDRDLKQPHYWSEVLDQTNNTFIPVDAVVNQIIASNKDLLALFEPSSTKSKKPHQVIAYVIGHSSDGSAKDVTTRYLKGNMWPGKTKPYRYPLEKIAVRGRNGKIKYTRHRDWFKELMSLYERGSKKSPRQKIDDIEEATDLKPVTREKKEIEEGKETLQYYKTSPEFVLERHLKREEALIPTAKHIKLFTVGKGDNTTQEKVYLRKDVVLCKSTETWHKEGRAPKPGEQPLKRVPYRAATTNRRRELAEAEHASGEKMLQGLFSQAQTEWIIPPPIENGIIPKNSFGNIDLYVDSMLPKGAVHIPYRGIPKICKRLNIDYAEAVTGFEFGRRMALPVITGVVVAEEYYDSIMEEWRKDEEERVRKEDGKRKQATLRAWRKILSGLRVLKRFKEEYGEIDESNGADIPNPFISKKRPTSKTSESEAQKMTHLKTDETDVVPPFDESDLDESDVGLRSGFFPVVKSNDLADDEDLAGGFIIDGHEHEDLGPATTSKKSDLPQSKDKVSSIAVLERNEENLKDDIKVHVPPLRKTQKRSKRAVKNTPLGVVDDENEDGDTETRRQPSKKQVKPAAASRKVKTKVEKKKSEPIIPCDTNGNPPKRNAPRRVKSALKSSYFEHSEDEDTS